MPTASINGTNLYYEEFGSGEEIVVSASMSLNEEDAYPALLAAHPTRYHVFQVQLSGFGKSSHIFEDRTPFWYDQWAEEIYQFTRHLGLERIIYTGISHGGGLGWYLALAHPEVLKAFVPIVGAPHDRDRPRTAGMGLPGAGSASPFYEVPTTDPVRLARRERRQARMAGRAQTPEEQAINPGKAFPLVRTNAELSNLLSGVTSPTLLIGGMQDNIIPPEAMQLAARAVTGSKLILFQDHAHSLASEAPEAVVAEVALFVDHLNTPTPGGG